MAIKHKHVAFFKNCICYEIAAKLTKCWKFRLISERDLSLPTYFLGWACFSIDAAVRICRKTAREP